MILLHLWEQKHGEQGHLNLTVSSPASQWSQPLLQWPFSLLLHDGSSNICLTFENSLRNPTFTPLYNVLTPVKEPISNLNLLTQYFINILCQPNWCPASSRPSSQGKVGFMNPKLSSLPILGPVHQWIIFPLFS